MEVPYEYFCKSCGQLRLCLDQDRTDCGNCGSTKLIIGEINSLDKDKLKGEFYALRSNERIKKSN